jgi:hypothetical protein
MSFNQFRGDCCVLEFNQADKKADRCIEKQNVLLLISASRENDPRGGKGGRGVGRLINLEP